MLEIRVTRGASDWKEILNPRRGLTRPLHRDLERGREHGSRGQLEGSVVSERREIVTRVGHGWVRHGSGSAETTGDKRSPSRRAELHLLRSTASVSLVVHEMHHVG